MEFTISENTKKKLALGGNLTLPYFSKARSSITLLVPI